MKEVKAVIQPHRMDAVLSALHHIGNLPIAVTGEADAIDTSPGMYEQHRMVKIELMVPDDLVETVVGAIAEAAHTGNLGDGRIFVIPIEESIVIRSGERGEKAR
ncbi:MAG: nitrogen regulatory protein P-II [Fimbriimonadales bacterium]|nr:MAG: nitrogen regulatory protein P-II [Fimbriimonadales bacterium]